MWSRGRTSSAGIHGRRFFRCCYFQLWKNLLSWLPVEEVLTRDGTEKSYSAVVNLQLRKNLIPWLAAEEVLQWDGTEEGSSIVVTLNAEEDFSAETLRGILENIKNCWVHQQSCWVPLAIPKTFWGLLVYFELRGIKWVGLSSFLTQIYHFYFLPRKIVLTKFKFQFSLTCNRIKDRFDNLTN